MISRLKSLLGDRNPLRLLYHRAKALAAALRYGFPARHLTIIGVTGTDGKTTTVGMIAHILHAEGIPVGALSTAYFRVKDQIEWNATQKTSPSPFTVQRFLRRLVREGYTHAVLEYSSHGLVQGRTLFTWPQVAGITNTSAEHLDYHGSMDRYRRDKGLLFRMLRGKGTKVLNAEDESYALYREIPSEKTTTFSSHPSPSPSPSPAGRGENIRLWLSDCGATEKGVYAMVHWQDSRLTTQDSRLTLPIPGTFNLFNALCAILCADAVGVPVAASVAALATFPGTPGRMERIDVGQPFAVYIDFTVTPASYEATLSSLRSSLAPGHRLLVLTGSCGDRMREKRPEVGKIVSKYADVMVVANEDPYTEDPEKIIDELWAGIDHDRTKAHRIFDRKKAIEFLLREAKPGDIVILCGKGSDTTMWLKEGQVPWNEREVTREILRTL